GSQAVEVARGGRRRRRGISSDARVDDLDFFGEQHGRSSPIPVDHQNEPTEVLAAVANPPFGEPLDALGGTLDVPRRPARDYRLRSTASAETHHEVRLTDSKPRASSTVFAVSK